MKPNAIFIYIITEPRNLASILGVLFIKLNEFLNTLIL